MQALRVQPLRDVQNHDFDFEGLETRFKKAFSTLVFRRVDTVELRGPIRRVQYTPFGSFPFEEGMIYDASTCEARCDAGFSGYTLKTPLKEIGEMADPIVGPIHFDSNGYAEPDIVQTGSFEMVKVPTNIFPLPNKGTGLYPDMVCGIVEPGKSADEYLPTGATPTTFHYSKWFICSPQFFNLWMLVMNPSSPHVNPPVNKNFPLQKTEFGKRIQQLKWMMSGDRLCVNNFHKWVVANNIDLHESIGDSSISKEIHRRYKRTRSESLTKMWVHTYAALAMMIRFRNFPDHTNVPSSITTNTNADASMGYWDIPYMFCEKVLGIVEREVDEDDDENVEEYSTPDQLTEEDYRRIRENAFGGGGGEFSFDTLFEGDDLKTECDVLRLQVELTMIRV